MSDLQQGMDTGAIRQSAADLGRHATSLDALQARAQRAISALVAHWEGDDLDALMRQWNTSSKGAIEDCARAMESMGSRLTQEADAQEKTSGTGGGGLTGGGGAGGGGAGGPGGPAGPGGSGGSTQDPDPGNLKKEFSKDYGTASPPGNPYAPDNTRTENADGTTTITDKDGNVWIEDTKGAAYPPGTVIGQDGTVHRGGATGEDGPGRSRANVDYYDNGDGTRGARYEAERTNDNPYTRWKAGESRPWNDESNPNRENWQRGSDLASKVGKDVTIEPLAEKKAGAEAEWNPYSKQWGDEKNNFKVSGPSAKAEAEASAGIGPAGATAAASATVGAYAASASGKFQTGNWGPASASGEGRAYVGAEATAGGEASIGPGGAKVGVNAEAFAGGKAEGSVTGKVGPASVGVGGEVSYGIGAHANVDAEASLDKVGVSVDVGATLGIGAGVKFDVSFSPKDVVDDIVPDIDIF